MIHDLTEEHKAKEEIINLNRELEQKVEERTEKLTEVVNKLLQSNLKLEEQIKERRAAEEALRQNEEELRQALEREKELSELKSRFVSMASHEFRTPLRPLLLPLNWSSYTRILPNSPNAKNTCAAFSLP